MNVRYYADTYILKWYEYTLELLRTLHDERDITVEVDCIDEQYGPITDFSSNIRYPSTEEVYERVYSRAWPELIARLEGR